MTSHSVAVVGGGIAGLVVARELAPSCAVTIYESDHEFGGKIRTGTFRGMPFDLGPDSFITRNRAAVDLCTEIGLGDELLPPSSSAAAIYANGELRPFPAKLVLGVPTSTGALFRSGTISRRAAVRTAGDLFGLFRRVPADLASRAQKGELDVTIEELFRLRLGKEVTSTLIDPLLGGINASDVAELSLAAAAPLLADALSSQKSVMRSLRPLLPPARRAAGQTGVPAFFGLSPGLGAMVGALVSQLRAGGVELARDATVRSIERVLPDGPFRVVFDKDVLEYDAIVLATPADVSASLVTCLDETLATELRAIPYAGVITVALAWPASAAATEPLRTLARRLKMPDPSAAGVLPGAGVLVAREKARLLTAVTFTSTKWPRSAPPGEIVVRASAGRHNDERALELDDEALALRVRNELTEVLGIVDDPLEISIERWPRSFPQYVSGHLHRRSRIDTLLRDHHGLFLAGAAYDGIGIPACIDSGRRAATAVTKSFDRSAGLR